MSIDESAKADPSIAATDVGRKKERSDGQFTNFPQFRTWLECH
jgi:hypothetical protein